MMAGNPNWWSNMHPQQQQQQLQPSSAALLSASSASFFPPQYFLGSSNNSPSLPFNSFPADHNQEQLPQSWSQLLQGGSTGEVEDRFGQQQQLTHHFQHKKLENWEEDQILYSNHNPSHGVLSAADHVKQELIISQNSTNNNQLYSDGEFQAAQRPVATAAASWTQVPASSPRSCVTSLSSSSNILDFSYNQTTSHDHHGRNNNITVNQLPDQSSECNSTATGGVCKKARVQSSSSQPPLKVRKEKLGDRITALHQLVSPFGKTDTASVLLEAIGYIRFLQSQIEALSSPYMASNLRNHNQHSVQGERSCAFPEEKIQDVQGNAKDLRSRGLCLVPVSVTQHVGSENGADYWSPAIGGSF